MALGPGLKSLVMLIHVYTMFSSGEGTKPHTKFILRGFLFVYIDFETPLSLRLWLGSLQHKPQFWDVDKL